MGVCCSNVADMEKGLEGEVPLYQLGWKARRRKMLLVVTI